MQAKLAEASNVLDPGGSEELIDIVVGVDNGVASGVAVLFGDKIRSQAKLFLCLFQLVAAKNPVYESCLIR